MSYKSIIFFVILFGVLLTIYFFYDAFIKICPIHIGIQWFVLALGIGGILFPHVFDMIKSGDDWSEVKQVMIEKYMAKKKSKSKNYY